MRFFARFTFICNLCFLASAFLWIRRHFVHAAKIDPNAPLEVNYFVSTAAVLGLLSIVLNLVFVVMFIARYPSKKMNNIPRWIVYFNMILLPAQIYYLFFFNF